MPIRPITSGKRLVFALAILVLAVVIIPIAIVGYQLHAARQNWQTTIRGLQTGDTTFDAACLVSEDLRDIEYLVFRSREKAGEDHLHRLFEIDQLCLYLLLSAISNEKLEHQSNNAMQFNMTKHEAAAKQWLLQNSP